MKREHRPLTRTEWQRIISGRPVVRRIPPPMKNRDKHAAIHPSPLGWDFHTFEIIRDVHRAAYYFREDGRWTVLLRFCAQSAG